MTSIYKRRRKELLVWGLFFSLAMIGSIYPMSQWIIAHFDIHVPTALLLGGTFLIFWGLTGITAKILPFFLNAGLLLALNGYLVWWWFSQPHALWYGVLGNIGFIAALLYISYVNLIDSLMNKTYSH